MSNTGTHILFLPRWYPHAYDPMFGLFIRKHALTAAQKYRVSVAYVHFTTSESRTEISEDVLLEIRSYIKKSGNPLLNFFRWMTAYHRAYTEICKRRGKPALTHVHILTRLGVLALFMRIVRGIPYVITEHWSRYQPGGFYHGALRKFLTRLAVRFSRGVTVPTAQLEKAMRAHGLNHTHYLVLANTVEKKWFYSEVHPTRPIKQLIHISCFEEVSKNMSGILKAIALLKQQRSDFHLYMVGEGMDWQQTVDLCRELHCDDVVTFTGLKQGEELASLLRGSDLMLMFSHYENLPVVISEALCCGVPVVSSDVGGIREVLEPRYGSLVPEGDTTAFVQAIHSRLNETQPPREEIAAYAAAIWYEDAVLQQLDHFYQSALRS
ncbi:MAG: glycosyltransferase [Flavobacteriales bacterium]